MPLPIAHGLLGASIVAAVHPRFNDKGYLPLLAGAVLANCPDLDFLIVLATHSRGWHRTFTHSFVFALVFGLVLFVILGRTRIKDTIAYGLAFASHGVLDFVSTKYGGGVELFWPFVLQRFKLGLVSFSEIPSRLSALEVIKALLLEFAIFAPLLLAILLIKRRSIKKLSVSNSASY